MVAVEVNPVLCFLCWKDFERNYCISGHVPSFLFIFFTLHFFINVSMTNFCDVKTFNTIQLEFFLFFLLTEFLMVIIYWDWPTLTSHRSIMFYRPKFQDKIAIFLTLWYSFMFWYIYLRMITNSYSHIIQLSSLTRWRYRPLVARGAYIFTFDHNKQINKSNTISGLISYVVGLGSRPVSRGYRTQP